MNKSFFSLSNMSLTTIIAILYFQNNFQVKETSEEVVLRRIYYPQKKRRVSFPVTMTDASLFLVGQ